MAVAQVGECELQSVAIVTELNEKCANYSTLSRVNIDRQFRTEMELQRLALVMDSFLDTEK